MSYQDQNSLQNFQETILLNQVQKTTPYVHLRGVLGQNWWSRHSFHSSTKLTKKCSSLFQIPHLLCEYTLLLLFVQKSFCEKVNLRIFYKSYQKTFRISSRFLSFVKAILRGGTSYGKVWNNLVNIFLRRRTIHITSIETSRIKSRICIVSFPWLLAWWGLQKYKYNTQKLETIDMRRVVSCRTWISFIFNENGMR